MLPSIQLPNGQPGLAVPPITHPGPAPNNTQGGVVAQYYREIDQFSELLQIKELANQVFAYAFPNQHLLLDRQDHTGTLLGEARNHFTYLWASIPQEDRNDAIDKNEDTLKDDYNINDSPHLYFKKMQDTRYFLVKLG